MSTDYMETSDDHSLYTTIFNTVSIHDVKEKSSHRLLQKDQIKSPGASFGLALSLKEVAVSPKWTISIQAVSPLSKVHVSIVFDFSLPTETAMSHEHDIPLCDHE